MSKMHRRGNKNPAFIAPNGDYITLDGFLTTLHPEGSFNDFQIATEKRILVRPKINYFIVVINVLIPLLLCFAICWWSVCYAIVCLSLYILIRMRTIILFFIRVYQRYASEDIRLACVFTPSCSEYMVLSIEKYGLIYGGIKGVKRLKRCNFPNGGEDYP